MGEKIPISNVCLLFGWFWLHDLTSKTKINVFKKFSSLHSKKFEKKKILAFVANSALSCQNGFFPSFSSLLCIWCRFSVDKHTKQMDIFSADDNNDDDLQWYQFALMRETKMCKYVNSPWLATTVWAIAEIIQGRQRNSKIFSCVL